MRRFAPADLVCYLLNLDLVCYLLNLGDDLQKWLAHDEIAREVVPQVAQELREIASALDTGASIDPIPGIPPKASDTKEPSTASLLGLTPLITREGTTPDAGATALPSLEDSLNIRDAHHQRHRIDRRF